MGIYKENIYDKIFNWVVATLFIILGIIFLYPFYYLLVFSFNEPFDAMRGDLYFFPRIFSTVAYQMVWITNDIGHAMFISLLRTAIGTFVTVFFTSMLAYILSHQQLVFRKFFNLLFVITMYVGGGLIPWYLTLRAYGFNNTFSIYIFPGMIGVFSMILIRTYIQEMAVELIESATIDGANDFIIYLRIVLPLCTPVLAVVSILAAVGQWNSWFDAAVFNSASKNLEPLQLILMNMLKKAAVRSASDIPSGAASRLTPESMRAAVTIIATVPILVVYPFFQKYFAQGVMLGAVKG